jgi:hypothetical protein
MVAIPQTPYDAHVFHSIQVFGDLVGIHFCPGISDETVIGLWNWKNGELQIVSSMIHYTQNYFLILQT